MMFSANDSHKKAGSKSILERILIGKIEADVRTSKRNSIHIEMPINKAGEDTGWISSVRGQLNR